MKREKRKEKVRERENQRDERNGESERLGREGKREIVRTTRRGGGPATGSGTTPATATRGDGGRPATTAAE
ncbi:hypothetical protein Scep_030261 [Stephania cephalantha]|uniref:Uncharacterized protein n=1 Tax=Stephania cephalantha TaxID=152367 RepID=A0AAP0HIH2_9MAGN